MRQQVIYYPETISMGDRNRVKLKVDRCPSRVYTLVTRRDENDRPVLPVQYHPRLVWLNDKGHDWRWSNGVLRYGSCPVGGRVWLLLEFDGEEADHGPPGFCHMCGTALAVGCGCPSEVTP